MKKVFFVLAFVAVYGVSMAMTTAVTVKNDAQVVAVEKEKDKDAKSAQTSGETKAKSGCCSDSKEKSGCAGEAKKDCSSSCKGGEKK